MNPRFWRWRPRDVRLDDELRYHVERQYDDYLRQGLSPSDARRRVGMEFGPLDLAKDECRDARPWRWVETTARDVRHGMRALVRERGFALSVVSILTIGIGAAVAMFSVLNGIVLQPLPYEDPHEVAIIATHRMLQNQFEGTSGANFVDWRQESRTFAVMSLYRRVSVSQVVIAGSDAPQRVQEGLVDAEFFPLLGVTPLVGRTFLPDEHARAERAVVLSEGLWRDQFGGAADALGRSLQIAGTPHIIVGVMPRSFQLPTSDTRLWRPLALMSRWPKQLSVRQSDQFEVIGRLRPGVRIDEARADMAAVAQRLREAHDVNENLDIRLTPLFDHVVGDAAARGVWLGFAAVMGLLVVAAANAAALLAARATRRRHELAVRAALGAGRTRLARQLIAENFALGLGASVAGLLVAAALLKLFIAYSPAGLPRIEQIDPDWATVGIALAGGLLVVMICGSVPALTGSRAEAMAVCRTRDADGTVRQRVQRSLVALQIAGATTLTITAVLLAQSFIRVQAEEPGYPAANLVIARIDRPASERFFLDVRERLAALPGVLAVGGINDFFIRRAGDQEITIEGRAFADPQGRLPKFVMDSVTPGYFGSMGIRIVEGRDFDDLDLEKGARPSVIVSHAVAERYWRGDSAVGKRLVGGSSPPRDGRWATVVGVVDDLRRERLDAEPVLAAYVPAILQSMDLTIRVGMNADSLIPTIRRELRAIDPSLPVPAVITANQRLQQQLGARRFQAHAIVGFAALAVVFAAAGLYAVMAYQVTLRRREIAVRAALGAQRRNIAVLFVRGGVVLALAGVTAGMGVAALIARVLQSQLYGTAAVDLRSYLLAASVVVGVTMLSAWRPARQAARIDPLTVLRDG